MNRLLLPISLMIALNGCTQTGHLAQSAADDDSAVGAQPQTFVFECADDYDFVARIEADKAWLFLPGKTIGLPLTRSDAGFEYASGSDSFRRLGESADLETGSTRHVGCRNNRTKAIWEHAKLNGVDFRATGNEPGWYLEISNRNDILLVTDYGQATFRFADARRESEPHRSTTIYNARSGNDQLKIVITGAPCTDSMSGDAFPATVSVRLNDRRYSGCGKALH